MARRKKSEIELEKKIENLCNKHAQGKQINIFDLAKISKAGYLAASMDDDVEKAIEEASNKYNLEKKE